jgi:hypothetical protein
MMAGTRSMKWNSWRMMSISARLTNGQAFKFLLPEGGYENENEKSYEKTE